MAPKRQFEKLTGRQRRMRYVGRRLLKLGVVAAVAAALVLADWAGIFGRAPKGDFATYDGRTFRVVRVVDGDTLQVDTPDGGTPYTRIRLWGVDTPEVHKKDGTVDHFGPEASEFVKKIAGNQMVRLELEAGRKTRDVHKRLLAFVYLGDGDMLNRLLIEKGYGYADPRFEHSRKAEFARIQRAAIKARCGLWETVKQSDLPHYYQGKLKLPKKRARP